MDTYLLGILFVFACVGLFYFIDRISRPLVRILLNGPFHTFYLQYLQANTKYEFEVASAANNSDRAWSGVVFQKVYEIGIKGVPYSRREQHLEYIKAQAISKPQFSRKLADELIKVLPKQYGNDDFRTKLACYICELLKQKDNSNYSNVKPVHGSAIDHLTTAISAWIAGSAYLLLSTYVLDRYPPFIVVLSNILLFLLMIIPLYNLIGAIFAKLSTILTIGTIIVLFLGAFATVAHGRTQSPIEIDLNPYQNPNAILTIHSPEWLTVNNVECNGKKISVSLHGNLATPIRFHLSDDSFYLLNQNCREIIPQLETSQTETEAYEFYIAARDVIPFSEGTTGIKVIPSYVTSSGEIEFKANTALNIRLEHWIWGMASNIFVALGSIGATTLLFVVNYFVSKRKS